MHGFIKEYREWMLNTMNNNESSSIELDQDDNGEKEENIVQEDMITILKNLNRIILKKKWYLFLKRCELKNNGDYKEASKFEKLPRNGNDTTDFDAEILFRLGMCYQGYKSGKKQAISTGQTNPRGFTKSLNKIGIINERMKTMKMQKMLTNKL